MKVSGVKNTFYTSNIKKMIGIYKWTSPSGKYYIGQAVNLKRRYNDFVNFKRTYTSKGSAIDNAREKYNSKDLWSYEILQECTREQLDELETKYINELDSANSRLGYNSTKGGDGTKGVAWGSEKQIQALKNRRTYVGKENPNYGKHHSEEAKKRISEAAKGRKPKNLPTKPVIQLTLDNKEIKTWDSITDAAKFLGCDKSLIMRVCQGVKKTAKGFHWKYKK